MSTPGLMVASTIPVAVMVLAEVGQMIEQLEVHGRCVLSGSPLPGSAARREGGEVARRYQAWRTEGPND